MQYTGANSSINTFGFVWFMIVTFCLVLWGIFAAWLATRWQMPIDIFSVFSQQPSLHQSLLIGGAYGVAAGFILVILAVFGVYNPILAFVIFLVGIIALFEFIAGNSAITDSRNLFWLIVIPFVIIRDLITHLMLRYCKRSINNAQHNYPEASMTRDKLYY